MKEMPGVVWKKLWGVNAENNLTEIMIAKILPRPLNKPPQMRGEYLGLKAAVSGSIMRAVTLLPTSFAPFPKAKANNTTSPISTLNNKRRTHPRPRIDRRFLRNAGSRGRVLDNICRVVPAPPENYSPVTQQSELTRIRGQILEQVR